MIAPWAEKEVAQVDLGYKRLDDRLVTVLSDLGSRPNLSIPAACGGRAEMKAAYRFFDNEKVTFDKVLEPHIARTKERIAEQPVVLLVQDTTEHDLTRPEQEVEGAGELDGARRGFLLHEMQAFTPEGTPLGTVWAEVVNRTEGVSHAAVADKQQQRKHTPIEEKESMRWLTGLRQARQVAQELPRVQCVCIGDSESDIYEVFAEPRGEVPVQWLIRACQDRATSESGEHLRDQVLATPVLYQAELLITWSSCASRTHHRMRRRWSGSWSRPCRSIPWSRCGRWWHTTACAGVSRFCSAP